MATYNKFNSFVEAVAEKSIALDADALKVMLTNVAPVATNTVKSDITEIAAGNGYTAGGEAVVVTSSAQSSGIYKLVANDITWTATGSMATFRYVVLYDSSNNKLIGWWDYGSSLALTIGQTFTVDASPTNGILQIA